MIELHLTFFNFWETNITIFKSLENFAVKIIDKSLYVTVAPKKYTKHNVYPLWVL